MQLAWATDVHFDCARQEWIDGFCWKVIGSGADALLITGDISQAPHLTMSLRQLDQQLQMPIYFVLGNHDYYGSGIVEVRRRLARFTRRNPHLHWLDREGIVPLTEQACLIGAEGWYDGRNGSFADSTVELTDFNAITELAQVSRGGGAGGRLRLLHLLQRLGDRDAARVRRLLATALPRFRQIIVATHVPPFVEACRYQGRPTGDDFLPFFSCQAVGEALMEAMARHPDHRMIVLSGHTHEQCMVRILPNLEVRVGGAEYGISKVASSINVN